MAAKVSQPTMIRRMPDKPAKTLSRSDMARKMRQADRVAAKGLQPYPAAISHADSGEDIAAATRGNSSKVVSVHRKSAASLAEVKDGCTLPRIFDNET
jgi:hypothetical protein